MYLKYQSEFFCTNVNGVSNTDDVRWRISIYKKTGTGSTITFDTTSDGFTFDMGGSNDSMLAPLKTTSITFNYLLDSANISGTTSTSIQEEIIDDLLVGASENEGELSLLIEKGSAATGGYRRWWIGAVLGDLSVLNDKSINRIITIKAVDGLTQLKYKYFDQDVYGGQRSLLYLIKSGLNLITCNHTDFGFWTTADDEKKRFIAHQPFYYNRAMNDGGTLDTTWLRDVNHDPLALIKINTIVFNNPDGSKWSWYKVLQEVVSSVQLRLMITPIQDALSSSGPSEIADGNCCWFLQSPLVNHGSADNSNLDTSNLMFYHNRNTNTDVAIEYDSFYSGKIADPTQKLAGGKETFIAPLYSFKSIYNHNILATQLGNPANYNSMEDGVGTYSTFGTGADPVKLTGITDTSAPGWPVGTQYSTALSNKIAEQKIIIRGTVEITPIDAHYYYDGVGYESGKEFWEEEGEEWSFFSAMNVATDNDIIMPRLCIKLKCFFTNTSGSGTGQTILYYYLGDERFSILTGSVPWTYQTTNSSTIATEATQSNQYPDNYAGYDGNFLGLKYDPSNPSTTVYEDSNGLNLWGTDIGESNYYWWGDPDNQVGMDTYLYNPWPVSNPFAFCSPTYFDVDVDVLSLASGWNNGNWITQLTNASTTEDFIIESPNIPVAMGAGDLEYGENSFANVSLFFGDGRDFTYDAAGNSYSACTRGWDNNKQYYSKQRGVSYSFTYTDVRVYLMGGTGESGSILADSSVGYYINTAGSPSEEIVSDELALGGVPTRNMDNWSMFTTVYPGEFKIYSTADSDTSVSGTVSSTWDDGVVIWDNTIWDWRCIYEATSDTNDLKIFQKRARQGLAHYPQLKRGLELTFMDTTGTREIERSPFSAIYKFTTGDWSTNQSGASIGFIVCGGSFTAGTGKLKLTLEDCTTFQRSDLQDNSYSTVGSSQILIAPTDVD